MLHGSVIVTPISDLCTTFLYTLWPFPFYLHSENVERVHATC
jgi:hypothetical protein